MTWKVLAPSPLPEGAVRNLLGSLGDRIAVSVPAARDRESLLAALGEAAIDGRPVTNVVNGVDPVVGRRFLEGRP
ncbi:hypothetical protein OG884_05065 [Streptosporangium sp. NBC_01755]|uniref:hypothetical protein n=1 Tax=unclassified Streptosporangium TaxID=2632669 RepID=UPI002DD9402A|nr:MULTISPECIES: hypothetical protein [unclassified Streptosporangium]WSA27143.1 hypothetical protein OIE13_04460 [Streptosporangium sp. NBC_01810]WSD01303.1 hypothetical protein OG884_05065 [Streptosporangium sp. NBC_01755]